LTPAAIWRDAPVLVGEQALFQFVVSGVGLAIPAQDIGTVSAVDRATPIPGAPLHILGLVVAGERVVAQVDLAAFFDLGSTEQQADPMFRRTLFVEAGELEAGLVCDRARGLVSVDAGALRDPSVLQGTRLRRFLTAEVLSRDGVVGVLDVSALLRAAAIP
jgi:purine-binding chemotaxis protein CheW